MKNRISVVKAFEKELKKYCAENSLSFKKALSFPRCGNKDVLFIQRVDKAKTAGAIIDNEPAEVLISAVREENGKIRFSMGIYAKKYLGD